ncbi:hypothetical protein COT94_01690 [Candidatus Falkowbacteria bacterium CG10_big_fil_rev_8_21_14_0_10_37_14]|uniref:Segregation and condensation protein A n=1 Tax=Candidatus Falkowbacteria bacterium CG10_big_fil_rev_8_21_14_0_10_37_14 TaxID=1974561 RepID=A0A2M6WTQ3_9BACT|nr:segregation/condensation protein A [Candidatus Falkowbacteria bacterium]PIT96160.1 MAG: hypothetical protein COT94_01690 [Candidatus Falkowbacteria bacterium CG10_big_fil_rev_8_21_14_0_10_37_14]
MLIQLEKFEGPLALLLKMIEGEELDITTISLAKIADEYVAYIKNHPEIDPEEIADFLVVAAKLLLIKSRALLPYLYPAEDSEVDDFATQVRMYKEYLRASKLIEKLVATNQRSYLREFSKQSWSEAIPKFTAPTSITADRLRMIAEDIVARWSPAQKLDNSTLHDHMNIEDKIEHIRQLLSKNSYFYFNNFIKNAKSKTEVIVGFLAVLELMKQRDILIEQVALFGEIEVKLK